MRWLTFFLPLTLLAGPYTPQDYSSLVGMKGFSKALLELHFKLYQGYVKQANDLSEALPNAEGATYGALKRRFEWEFNGMRLHELYFSNLGGTGVTDPKSAVIQAISSQYGSFEAWKRDFLATGSMRGIGWAILYLDTVNGRLMNAWIEEHDVGHPALAQPLLVMDVFEHAYMPQYGLDKAAYLDAFFQNIDWNRVAARFDGAAALLKPLPR